MTVATNHADELSNAQLYLPKPAATDCTAAMTIVHWHTAAADVWAYVSKTGRPTMWTTIGVVGHEQPAYTHGPGTAAHAYELSRRLHLLNQEPAQDPNVAGFLTSLERASRWDASTSEYEDHLDDARSYLADVIRDRGVSVSDVTGW